MNNKVAPEDLAIEMETAETALLTAETEKVSLDTPKSSGHLTMKRLSLVLLAVQNVVHILLVRYVRTLPGPRFIKSTFVFVTEIQRTIFSILLVWHEERSIIAGTKKIFNQIFGNPRDTLMVSIPAFIYTIQNNLIIIAVSNLDAPTYMVTNQLKIFTTAMFTVTMLNRRLGLIQWLSLVSLFCGICLVQVDSITSKEPKKDVNAVVGLLAMVCSSISSGFAGVFIEKLLKNSDVSVWIRNIQLGMFSVIGSLSVMFIIDGKEVQEKGILYGYSEMVWMSTIGHSLGGLIVALVIKYADNILKGFASASAIILACIISVALFDFQMTVPMVFGSLLVIVSILAYSNVCILVDTSAIDFTMMDNKHAVVQLLLPTMVGLMIGMTIMYHALHQSKMAPLIATKLLEERYYPENKALPLPPVSSEYNVTSKKRICLVNIDTRPLQRFSAVEGGYRDMTFSSLSTYSNLLYARLHGYDYQRIVVPPFQNRYHTWSKVYHLYDMVQSMAESHDVILFLDADAYVADIRMPLERLLTKWKFDEKAQLLLSLDVSSPYAKDTHGRTVLNTGVIFLRPGKRTPGCEQWRHKWGHEQSAFSEYFRDAFIPDVELLSMPCNEGLGYSEDPYNCHGIYISHVTMDKESLRERYKQRLIYGTLLSLERELFRSHVTYPSTNDIDLLDMMRQQRSSTTPTMENSTSTD
ncbi:unnamed protein product [Adineta ricciae]|uniref:Uncharacterized protein n=1 Tax=Adineta ricciae TaxID=249248 RepID=A0A815ELV7_ADIRI|nr:unnamed protein product [Adineta ricciae]